MIRKGHVLVVLLIGFSAVTVLSISAEESLVPSWIKNTANYWAKGAISDQEYLSSIEWMINSKLIKVQLDDEEKVKTLEESISNLEKENQRLNDKNTELCDLYLYYYSLYVDKDKEDSIFCERTEPEPSTSQNCFGNARCFTGIVTRIIDGDTIEVNHLPIRFALVNSPEEDEPHYDDAKDFVKSVCPVGSIALVDEDDKQTEGSYGRIIGVVYCNNKNLNEEVLESGLGVVSKYFCPNSEFETHQWAQSHGC